MKLIGLLLGLCTVAGCGATESDGTEAETESATTGTSNGQTRTSSAVTQTDSTSASVTTTTASSATAAGGSGSGGAASDGSATASGTTGVGGAAGDANTTSDEACPNEPPAEFSTCPRVGQHCYYEDCAGVGRSRASCLYGTWSLNTTECSETVDCDGGSEQCSEGEICLIRAGGAFLQECLPNTCGTGSVECDCIEGCFGECATHGNPGTGITITCNTCPSGMACP